MFSSDTPIAVLEYVLSRWDRENIVRGVSDGMFELAVELVPGIGDGTPICEVMTATTHKISRFVQAWLLSTSTVRAIRHI